MLTKVRLLRPGMPARLVPARSPGVGCAHGDRRQAGAADRGDRRDRPRDRRARSPSAAPPSSSARARGRSSRRSPPSLPGGGHSVVVSDLAEPGAAERLAAEATAAGADRPPRRQRRPARLRPALRLQRRRGRPRGPRQPRVADDPRPRAAAGDGRAPRRPPALRLLARRQGRLAARLRLQRDEVRPPRLRSRAARGPRRRRLPASASRSCCPGSSATPACSPTPAPRSRPASARRRPRRSPPASSRRSSRTRPRSRSRRSSSARSPASPTSSPAIAARAQRGGGTKVAEHVARGQTDKR